MRKKIKSFAARILVPITRWYLRRERNYVKDGICVTVWPGVFHPGLFSSTSFLLEYIKHHDLRSKTLLELGCGSGFLSIFASKAGANVTASDKSSIAVRNTIHNVNQNNVAIHVIHSDMFDDIPDEKFDWIIINPPYYPLNAKKEEDLAWHCGENFEYFQKLFLQLGKFSSADTIVVMVLTLGCDLERIFSIGTDHGFKFQLIKEKRVFFDKKDLIYLISPINSVAEVQV